MASAVNTGARLDRLPISSFHYRIFWLIGAGMFFDGYDLYVGASVLGAAVQTKFATLAQVPQFISWTFVGMTIGAVIAGFLGDRFGRRFTYQFNLLVFGARVLRRRRGAQHGLADRRAVRDGPGPRRRDRGRLLDHDRIRAAGLARPLDGLHGLPRRRRLSRHLDHQHAGHPRVRLAADVRHCRRRRPDRLVSPQAIAREPALARKRRAGRPRRKR